MKLQKIENAKQYEQAVGEIDSISDDIDDIVGGGLELPHIMLVDIARNVLQDPRVKDVFIEMFNKAVDEYVEEETADEEWKGLQ